MTVRNRIRSDTGRPARVQRCILNEHGRLYLETDIGFGLVHTQDMTHAAEAVEQGLWLPSDCHVADLPGRFNFVKSPESLYIK